MGSPSVATSSAEEESSPALSTRIAFAGANGYRAPPRGDTGGSSAGGGGGGGNVSGDLSFFAISIFRAAVGSFPESVRCSSSVSASASSAAGEPENRGDRGAGLDRLGDAGGDATAIEGGAIFLKRP